MIAPAKIVKIVHATLLRIAQDIVGGNDEAIALKSGCVRNLVKTRVRMPVRMVKFDQLMEAPLVVRVVLGLPKYLVGCRVFGRGPMRCGVIFRQLSACCAVMNRSKTAGLECSPGDRREWTKVK